MKDTTKTEPFKARNCTVYAHSSSEFSLLADALPGDLGASLGPIYRLPLEWPEDEKGREHWALNIGGFRAANNAKEAAERWAKSVNWKIIA